MARHRRSRRSTQRGSGRADSAPARFHNPFASLRRALRGVTTPAAKPIPPSTPQVRGSVDSPPKNDQEFFTEAMEDVVPLHADERRRVDGPAPAGKRHRPPVTDEAEALAELADLVSGAGALDLADTDEYIEGRVAGLDPRVVRRLRRGDFAYQAHLDLHHLTVEEARAEVDRFLAAAYRKGQRCVLIIHGRGHNSKDQIPVLKERLMVWLGRGTLARYVLAFTTARACDGGAGAIYVLLRRRRRGKAPFVVTEGAKR
jgi:DNA-nicking Smr family endonuclease